jgi:hypothetical protein
MFMTGLVVNKVICKYVTRHLWIDSSPAGNKGFAIAGVPCFADTFVQGGSSVLRMKFSANNPRHRKPPNLWLPFSERLRQ